MSGADTVFVLTRYLCDAHTLVRSAGPYRAARERCRSIAGVRRGHEPILIVQRSLVNDPKENSRAFPPSVAVTEMNAAAWGIAASECRAAWAQCQRGSRLCPLPFSFAHSPKT